MKSCFLRHILYIFRPKRKEKKNEGKKERKEERKKKKNILCFSIEIPMSPMRPGLPISGLQIEIPKLGPGSWPDPVFLKWAPRLNGLSLPPHPPAQRDARSSLRRCTAEATRTSFSFCTAKNVEAIFEFGVELVVYVVFTCIGKKPSCWIREEI
jgi:hypothetical protein